MGSRSSLLDGDRSVGLTDGSVRDDVLCVDTTARQVAVYEATFQL